MSFRRDILRLALPERGLLYHLHSSLVNKPPPPPPVGQVVQVVHVQVVQVVHVENGAMVPCRRIHSTSKHHNNTHHSVGEDVPAGGSGVAQFLSKLVSGGDALRYFRKIADFLHCRRAAWR